ncbi:RICIN domain-containing protein [Leifsonia sp. TF02-11]|uniref:RICIN domain-containing protein n=1 Tax=Leifsonia sp. TF02-11 TaxID=2815212 RepID=UPI001AA18C4D|nr:RICIN domain-containing protein [Leifsonia sp. TF02-11]MBO1740155.1 hypothetical protein [Leifsonia sp. TF02-11]
MRIARWILSATAALSAAGLVSAIPASAGWSARVTATGSVTVGQESVAVSPTAVSTVMTNSLYQTTYLVNVTNTQASTTFTGPSNVTLTALPATDLGTALAAAIWPVASAADCTNAGNPAPGAVSGEWSSGVTSAAVALAPQASALFCVRGYPTGGSSSSANSGQRRENVAAALGSTSGATSFTPSFRADIALANLGGQATEPSDPITTSLIYPFYTLSNLNTYYQVKPQNILSPAALCIGVSGVGVGTGSVIFTAACSNIGTNVNLGNQAIAMIPVSGMNAIQLRIRTTAANNGFIASAGSNVVITTSNPANTQQLWIPQLVSTTGGARLQLVNAGSGLCLTALTAGSNVTTRECASDGAMQTYWYPVALPFP